MNRQQAKQFLEHCEKDPRGGYHIIDSYSIYVPELKDISYYEDGPINKFAVIDGLFTFSRFHWWDGASGFTLDDTSSMRASLIHDAIYRLMELGVLSKKFRKIADKVMLRTLKDDGMWFPRARLWFKAVRVFGGFYLKGKK
jgi:hypothetical protein